MIEKRTTFSGVTVTEAGHLEIRVEKQIVEDGVVLQHEYHRTSVECGGDLDAQLAEVNRHLVSMKCAPISVSDIVRIKNIAQADWTPARVAKWQVEKAKSKLLPG